MDDAAPDALADVAYGLFEHILNKGLEKKGQYLFTRVEGGYDFQG